MSTVTHAHQIMRRGFAAAVVSMMLATAGPAYAQSDDDTATAVSGNGGSVLVAANVAALNCVLLVGACGEFGGGNATGGNSGNATAINGAATTPTPTPTPTPSPLPMLPGLPGLPLPLPLPLP